MTCSFNYANLESFSYNNFADAVSENYSKESNMIFLTGVIVAIGLEYCNLHRRIALRVITVK